jgi:hypothetical protein
VSDERVEQLLRALDSAPAEPDPAFVSRLGRLVHDEATERAVPSITPTNEYVGEPIMINLDLKTTKQTSTEHPSRWRLSPSVMQWGAALTLLVGIAAVVVLASQDDPPANVASEGPMATVDQYFDAFNAGDADAVVSLLTPDAALSERFGSVGDFDQFERMDWEEELVRSIAEESLLADHECTEADGGPAGVTMFRCDYGFRDALTQAVDAPSIPVITRFAVTADGKISDVQVNYNEAETLAEPGTDFLHVGRPFGRWMLANHPEFAGLAITDAPVQDCCESMSPTERGASVLQYAREWAAYLESNGCSYLDGC